MGNELFAPPPLPEVQQNRSTAGQDEGVMAIATDFRQDHQKQLRINNRVEPEKGYIVSNRTRDNTIYYIPGILTDHIELFTGDTASEAIYAAQQIANMRGKPVEFVDNTSNGIAGDFIRCAACATSDRLGLMAERPAVEHTIALIDQALKSGDFPAEFYCHSGGNQIFDVASALYARWLNQNGMPAQEVARLLSNITVYRYGSPQNNSPAMRSYVFENRNDPVTKLRPFLDAKNAIIDLIQGDFRDATKPVSIEHNPGDSERPLNLPLSIEAHAIIQYLNDNPRYYDQSRRHVSPAGRAYALYASIDRGFFSNPEFEKIINHMLTSSELSKAEKKAFAKELYRLAPSFRIGKYYFSQNSIDLIEKRL